MPTRREARTSVLPEGQNLGAGGIHFRRACEIPRGNHKNSHTLWCGYFYGAADGSRTRTPVRTQAPQACQSTNSSTAACC